jgi:hypothetical protein
MTLPDHTRPSSPRGRCGSAAPVSRGLTGLGETALIGEDQHPHSVTQAQLPEHIGDVSLDRAFERSSCRRPTAGPAVASPDSLLARDWPAEPRAARTLPIQEAVVRARCEQTAVERCRMPFDTMAVLAQSRRFCRSASGRVGQSDGFASRRWRVRVPHAPSQEVANLQVFRSYQCQHRQQRCEHGASGPVDSCPPPSNEVERGQLTSGCRAESGDVE